MEFFPVSHNVFLGPNNTGKTAVLEALNLLLNPEVSQYSHSIDENDFFKRQYLGVTNIQNGEMKTPSIFIEAILDDLSEDDEDKFREHLVPWLEDTRTTVESCAEGVDPFAGARKSIRVVFEGSYDSSEDDFSYDTYFLRQEGLERIECPKLTREHKRRIGFLIYRDFRALTRPVTLEPSTLFGVLLKSQAAQPRNFEESIGRVQSAIDCLRQTPEFDQVINSYKAELERFMSLSSFGDSQLCFQLTDGTREQIKAEAQLHVFDDLLLPLKSMGAGTRSLAILGMLTLIMRKRGRGILALEEPETFLFPHAQRRVLDECTALAKQTFVTTHSPFVLERMPVEGVGRIMRSKDGTVSWSPLPKDSVRGINHFSKTLRQAQCEALVGKGVILTEGESDRCWVLGASRLLNGQHMNGQNFETLELIGISVISSEGNGSIPKYGKFFQTAGLTVLGLFDKTADNDVLDEALKGTFPCIFLKYSGLESMLSEELEIFILKMLLQDAPFTVVPKKTPQEISLLSDGDTRREACDFLKKNKGTIPLHEWIISQLDYSSVPASFKTLMCIAQHYFVSGNNMGVSSIL